MRKLNKKNKRFEDELKLFPHTVEHDKFDKDNFDEIRDSNDTIRHTFREMEKEYVESGAVTESTEM